MDFPWHEPATLVRMSSPEHSDDQFTEVLFEGSLLSLATKVREMKRSDRRRLKLSLPDSHVRPYTFQAEALDGLIEHIPERA